MKTSSGLLLGVLFTLVVVIIAVVIYFNTRPEEEKPKPVNDPGPSPTLPTISDLIIAQTFSPDGNEPYTIEPYTIEPYTPSDIIGLSKNVSFTLTWKNGSGFAESGVLQIKVFHIVKSWSSLYGGTWVTKEVLRNISASTSNFTESSVSISGLTGTETAADGETGPYSFVGKNFFKIVAVMPTGTADVILYDGWQSMNVSLPNLRDNLDRSTTRNIDGKVYTLTLSAEDLPLVSDKFSQKYDARVSKAGIIEANLDGKRITDDDLVGTIGMATPETITFTPRLDNTQGQSIGKSISNKRYDFYYYETPTADSPTLIFSNIRLVPVDAEGKTFKLEKSDDKFLKGIKVMKTGTTTSGAFDMTLIGKQGFVQTFEFNDDTTTDPMIVHISQSEESNNLREHDKVIMIKQIINDVDYYLFGDHFDLLGSKTNSDDFFKRNIYITDSSTS